MAIRVTMSPSPHDRYNTPMMATKNRWGIKKLPEKFPRFKSGERVRVSKAGKRSMASIRPVLKVTGVGKVIGLLWGGFVPIHLNGKDIWVDERHIEHA